MSLVRVCASWLIGGAERLIPPAKADWVRAMAVEEGQIARDRDALAFAAGCVRAAGLERLRSAAPDGAWFWSGAAFGLLFLATALIPGSRALPLLWAPLGGILTVLTLEQSGRPIASGGAVRLAAKTGALGGILFFAGVVLVRLVSAEAPSAQPIAGLAIAGVALALLTTISGAAVAPLIRSAGPGTINREGQTEMNSKAWQPARTAGLALGVLYLIEAVIATGILFALWPVLGGIFAAALTRRNPAIPLTTGTGAAAGAKAGVVGGLVLLIVGTPITVWLLARLGEQPGLFGITFGLGPIPTLLLMFSIYALFGILVAAAAGALTGLLRAEGSTRPY